MSFDSARTFTFASQLKRMVRPANFQSLSFSSQLRIPPFPTDFQDFAQLNVPAIEIPKQAERGWSYDPRDSFVVFDLALFNLAIDSKLHACDLVKIRVSDVSHGGQMASRAMVMQQKTGRPVQFEITQSTREAVRAWITYADLKASDFLFRSRVSDSPHLSTRQYARIAIAGWKMPASSRAPTARTRCAGPKHR